MPCPMGRHWTQPVLPAIRKTPSHTILNPERLWRRA